MYPLTSCIISLLYPNWLAFFFLPLFVPAKKAEVTVEQEDHRLLRQGFRRQGFRRLPEGGWIK